MLFRKQPLAWRASEAIVLGLPFQFCFVPRFNPLSPQDSVCFRTGSPGGAMGQNELNHEKARHRRHPLTALGLNCTKEGKENLFL